jgi:hypothetical protein
VDITLLTKEYFLSLYSLKNPQKQTRNITLVLLTLFHHKLDYLAEDSSDQELIPDESHIDREWSTIRSFFKYPERIVSILQDTEKCIKKRSIEQENFDKALTIY